MVNGAGPAVEPPQPAATPMTTAIDAAKPRILFPRTIETYCSNGSNDE